MKRFLALFAVAGAILVSPFDGSAQAEQDVDRVVAIVGDSVVLLSQVLQREFELRSSGVNVPTLEAAREEFLREVLDDLVSNQLLLQAASQDTLLSVDDTDLEDRLQQQIAQTQQGFGGQTQMEQVLLSEGLSMQTYRSMIREQIRQGLLIEQYVRRHGSTAPVEVTDTEMRRFFEEQRGRIQQRPATATFRQVAVTVEASDSAKAVARAKIDSLLVVVQEGADFSETAQAHSMDPGSAEAGGDLGWFRRGALAQAFEDAAFNLLESEVSEVVETPFGYHIIKVDRARFAERKARHILITPDVVPSDVVRTRALVDELKVRAETEGLEPLAEYHDPMIPDSATIPVQSLEQAFSAEYRTAVEQATDGSFVGPVEFTVRGRTTVALVEVVEKREAGAYVFEDLEDQIRQQLLQQKRLQKLVDDLKGRTFVELKLGA